MRYTVVVMLTALITLIGQASATEPLSDREARAYTDLVDLHVTSTIAAAEQSLFALDEITKRQRLSELDGFAVFARLAHATTGTRAIIFVGPDGQLIHDSYSYPLPDVNLRDRAYFELARESDGISVVIGKREVGRTSGIPFIPVALRAIRNEEFGGVLTAIITPEFLLPQGLHRECVFCGVFVLNSDSEPIVQFPNEMRLSDEVWEALEISQRATTGDIVVEVGPFRARMFWKRNSRFPLTSVFVEVLR